MTMVDWFEIHKGHSHCIIKRGLRHADGKTKSPYHYEKTIIRKDCLKTSLEEFNNWWNNLLNKND